MFNFRFIVTKALQELRLNKIAHKIYYNHIHGFQPANKDILPALDRCMKKANEFGSVQKGDYYEFGIFKGYSLYYSQKVANQHNIIDVRFFGFDSFSGLPSIQGRDSTNNNTFYQGQYSWAKEKVEKDLTIAGIDWKRTFLIDGYFHESLHNKTKEKYGMGKIAIALIDCDLYASTVDVLNFIQDMIINKTIIIFDDWNCFNKDNERGQRKAFREFLDKNGTLFIAEKFFSYGSYGQVFIISIQDEPAFAQ